MTPEQLREERARLWAKDPTELVERLDRMFKLQALDETYGEDPGHGISAAVGQFAAGRRM